MKSIVSMIAALGTNRVIGRDNALLWQIPEDMKRFKELTTGHPVIMGRKTWESIPEKFRPLRGRTNIVITRDASYAAEGAFVATSLDEALAHAKSADGAEEVFVMGGQQIYEMALPFADRLYLTRIDDAPEGDAYFPEYESEFTREITRENRESKGIAYSWVSLERT
jgi:dihydrofolate reductase